MINNASHQVDAHSQQNMTGVQATTLELFNLSEVAKMLQVSRITVYRLIAQGAISVYRVGRRMRFQKQDVLDYLERNRYGRQES